MAGQGGGGGGTLIRGPPSHVPLDLSPLRADGQQGDQGGQERVHGEAQATAAVAPTPPVNDATAIALNLGQVLQHFCQQLSELNDRLAVQAVMHHRRTTGGPPRTADEWQRK